jgi:hypothetical protein
MIQGARVSMRYTQDDPLPHLIRFPINYVSRFLAIGQLRELCKSTSILGPALNMLERADKTSLFLDAYKSGLDKANRELIIAKAERLLYEERIWIG